MPLESKAQTRLMQGVAHNAAFARKVGIPQSVGQDFVAAGPASPHLPQRVDRRTKSHRDAIRTGKTHPRSHSEFERLGR